MTSTVPHPPPSRVVGSDPPVVPVVVDVDGVPMSGLLAAVHDPRAVVVALHGGATTSKYFDCPGHPDLSLLRAGMAAGFTVLALDRPGYGSSRPFVDRFGDAAVRVEAMFAAIDGHLGAAPRGAGIFLVAHSAGSHLGVRMAADDRGSRFLGLELAGTGRVRQPDAETALSVPKPSGRAVAELLWQPHHLYPHELVGGGPIVAGGPRFEGAQMQEWTEVHFPRLAARTTIPVRFSVGQYERVWRNDPAGLADIADLFAVAPRVVLNVQPHSGHNLSLGYTARAYHLKLLSFVEECAVARESGEFSGPARQLDGATLILP
ncbi:alpha/beta hydrolase [Nocardia sp. XZ_19_231]|uniref:alpha/beta hydrolase n=1 Tax=Nocardia sp. XZ_19_231 TaxID=2769252 RepID=UPI00188DC844|nr:alpha/beta hydrolase [Nocardia sp. XZ_19_231]